MPTFVYARHFPAKYKKDSQGEYVLKNGKPVEKPQFFKNTKGELIAVPGNGFVVRNDAREDVAMTREEFMSKYKRFKVQSSQGMTTAKSEMWQRYVLKE